jgi:hypothetical protein
MNITVRYFTDRFMSPDMDRHYIFHCTINDNGHWTSSFCIRHWTFIIGHWTKQLSTENDKFVFTLQWLYNKHILFLWFSSQLDRVRHSGLWYIFRNSNEQVDTKATTTVLKYLVISKDFYHGPKSTQKVRITLQQTLRHTLLTASYIYV